MAKFLYVDNNHQIEQPPRKLKLQGFIGDMRQSRLALLVLAHGSVRAGLVTAAHSPESLWTEADQRHWLKKQCNAVQQLSE